MFCGLFSEIQSDRMLQLWGNNLQNFEQQNSQYKKNPIKIFIIEKKIIQNEPPL